MLLEVTRPHHGGHHDQVRNSVFISFAILALHLVLSISNLHQFVIVCSVQK